MSVSVSVWLRQDSGRTQERDELEKGEERERDELFCLRGPIRQRLVVGTVSLP